MWIQSHYFKHHKQSEKLMPLYECNEQQFVENIRRMIESSERFLVNRKISLHDDARYGPSTLPDVEFEKYAALLFRKSVRSAVFSRTPFIDDFHKRMYDQGENLHSSSNLNFPRFSIPYYRAEYSINLWGGTYFFSFDALFYSEIRMEKRKGKLLGKEGSLIHVLRFKPPAENVLNINLPKEVMVFDVKNMVKVIDYTSNL
jgi:hypothetical protein